MKKIALIEDDLELKELLEKFINYQEEYKCNISVNSVEAFLESIKVEENPDVIITDIGLPGVSGVDAVPMLKNIFPDVEIIMLTIHDYSDMVFKALCNGASGYLLKNTPLQQIKEAIDVVLDGGSPMSPKIARKVVASFKPRASNSKETLTPRENEIVQGLVDGLSYKLIADRYSISIDTVRQHIRNIYRKLNVNCKAEVISKHFRGEV